MKSRKCIGICLALLPLLSCDFMKYGEEGHRVQIYSSEIFLIDVKEKTKVFLGTGTQPRFNSREDAVIFLEESESSPQRRKISSVDLDGRETKQITDWFDRVADLIVSPDDGKVVFNAWDFTNRSWDIFQVDENGSHLMNLTHTVDIDEGAPDLSHGNDRLCFSQIEKHRYFNQLVVMDFNGAKRILRETEINRIQNPRFTLNDTRIVFFEEEPVADGARTLMMVDLGNPGVTDTLRNLPQAGWVSNAGMLLFGDRGSMKLYDLSTRQEGKVGTGTPLAISADGSRIIYTDADYRHHCLMTKRTIGDAVDTLVTDEVDEDAQYVVYDPVFSKSGDMIVYSKESLIERYE